MVASAIWNLVLFLAFLLVLMKSADVATRYSSRLARLFHLSEFIVSFFVVAIISALPEATISIISAIEGVPEFGLGTLLGSNVADLALVFGIIALLSPKGVSVKSEVLKEDLFYLVLLFFPVLLGLDGTLSLVDGFLLVIAGFFFFYTLSIESNMFRKKFSYVKDPAFLKNFLLLVLSLLVLIVSANYTIRFGTEFAKEIQVPAIFISLTVVSIGTCLPELLFSIRAVKNNHDELALGDILGTVIIDATIVLGVLAIIRPFSFNPTIMLITGASMFLAGLLAVLYITSGKVLTKKEGIYLLIFYLFYLLAEIFVAHIF